MRLVLTTMLFAACSSGEMMNNMTAQLIVDYFSSPTIDVSTVILVTCSAYDEQIWLRHIFDGDVVFFTGRGGLGEKCELRSGALQDTYRRLGVFVDYDCPCARNATIQVDRYNFTLDTIAWLFWSTRLEAKDLEFLELNLTIYNEVRFLLQDSLETKLYDVFRVYDGMSVESVLAATLNSSGGFVWRLEFDKYSRRIDFRNATLTAGLMILEFNASDPNLFETFLDHNKNRTVDTNTRIYYSLWLLLQEVHNFSLKMTTVNKVGYTKQADGTYDGLMGLLQTGKVDVSISGLGLFNYRLDILDYNNYPVWPFSSSFFFLQPRFLERSTLLIYPFQGIVWLSSFLIVLTALLLISLIATYDKSLKVSMGSALLYISAIFSQQGAVLRSQWASGRLLLFTSLIFGFMLLNYYSGQVVSEILSKPPSAISSSNQLLDSPLLMATDTLPAYLAVRHKTLRSHNIPKIGMKVERTGGFMSLDQGIAKVKSSLYAFETEASKGYDLIERTFSQAEICSVGEIPMPVIDSHLVLKHHSSFKQPFSITVLALNERGILKRMKRMWLYPKPKCLGATNIIPVDLENTSIAFYILFSGAVAGCIVYYVETWAWERSKTQKPRRRCSISFKNRRPLENSRQPLLNVEKPHKCRQPLSC